MKYMKRSGIYKASSGNVTFNPETKQAYSYAWWRFVGLVEGKLVFNNYRYSNTTSKHQSKVRALLSELNIKIDIEMPVPAGLQPKNMRGQGQEAGVTLQDLIVQAEEHICDKFIGEQIRKQERYQRTKARKLKIKLEEYLENSVCFRDYDVESAARFGSINKIAVHQVVSADSMEHDVQNALHSFQRDGFGSIVFYVEGL